MIDFRRILPDWYIEFLKAYDLLKNDSGKFYFLPELEEFHHQLGQSTLLRLDDQAGNEYLSIGKRTMSVRDHLLEREPDFPGISNSVVIGRSGFCDVVDEWSTSVLLMVKQDNRNELYFLNTDSAMKARRITADFDSFFPDLSAALAEAGRMLAEKKLIYRRNEAGELYSAEVNYLSIKVRIEAVKPLSVFLDENRYAQFDSEGFESAVEYAALANRLLSMTGLEYAVSGSELNPNAIQIKIQAEVQEIAFSFNTDYFNEAFIEVLNAMVSKSGASRRFQEIYPFTIHQADQTMAIGFCTPEEIALLKAHEYVQA